MGPYPEFQDVVNKVNTLVAELQNLMVSLDTLNIIKLNAKVIEAGTVTAEKMNVDELSAISANLGHITAGLVEAIEIFGSYIATAAIGVYPRIELSSLSKLLKAELDADNRIELLANLVGSPAFNFITELMVGRLFAADSTLALISNEFLQLEGDEVYITSDTGYVNFQSWAKLKNTTSSTTLQQALDAKANSFAGYSGSFNTGAQVVTVSNGIITSVV
jgi:hypothetical protein